MSVAEVLKDAKRLVLERTQSLAERIFKGERPSDEELVAVDPAVLEEMVDLQKSINYANKLANEIAEWEREISALTPEINEIAAKREAMTEEFRRTDAELWVREHALVMQREQLKGLVRNQEKRLRPIWANNADQQRALEQR
ncbi:MAG: hypothetical protein IT427_05815 [Pirellulales bacterium]|nr:hypothetical protein [Pirellulales bacterium]